ncbi:A/G-specific adenine glycosylase [Fibrobacter sp. UWB12]|uniref:A/G-specific adenine glycosylase n=1 Tax=Fibrobacter sp. UWB12 TaxID=1896203 RepID=UPI00091DF63C|nr:A/G-specific adenine glycosylase [Fibrobacter sp. UWB12]SHK39901.1 A/G-specific DNA-adenine glycosylase [Fibrobacter sp. UWB12]
MTPDSLKRLREWFRANAAELPWRLADLDAPRDAYAVWISETMLQQTQVSTVKDYFIRWMKRFPDIETLAKADEAEVFKYWQGLGYYSRARNILKTAKIVVNTHRDCHAPCKGSRNDVENEFIVQLPETRKELEALPGIGAYTAGAILSLAYHKREAILDGNLVRIFSRLYELDFLPTEKNCAEIYWEYAREVADSPKAYMHNEALMELGRTICKIKSPLCDKCPINKECKAFADGRAAEFPPAKKRTEKSWHGTVLIVESADEKILAVNGGQKFLDGQLALPHFESARHATVALPAKAEEYINADEVKSLKHCGTFRHNITVHKIECDVLHVQLSTTAKAAHLPKLNANSNKPVAFEWIEKAKAFETFANSFSLKALKKIFN